MINLLVMDALSGQARLTCSLCSAPLRATGDAGRFACTECGSEITAGKIDPVKPIVDAVSGVKEGTDKTVAELALQRLYDNAQIGGSLNAFALGALIGSAFFAAGVGYSIYSGSKTGMHVGLLLHAIVTITISIIKGRMNHTQIQTLKSSVNHQLAAHGQRIE